MKIAEYLESESEPLRDDLKTLMAAYPADALVSPLRLSAGEFLLHEGELCSVVHILLKGRVSIATSQPRYSSYTVSEAEAIEFFGEFEILSGRPNYIAEIRAVSPCRLIVVPADAYLLWMHRDQELFFERVRSVLGTLLYQTTSERTMHFLDATSQVIRALIHAYEQTGASPGGVRVDATRAAIAEKTGNSVRTVNRVVRELAEKKLLTVKSGKIFLTGAQCEALKAEFEARLQ